MHISLIRLKNWGCFKGVHEIRLDAMPYAILAQRDGDIDRSNWNGKTMLLEAIPFALYGVHRHRLEEGSISHGETSGEVELYLSNGFPVRRWREPGAGTQLQVMWDGERVFKGDEAQRKIDEVVGLGLEDFRTTSYFAQGETAGMVRSDPAARTATVTRWLKLEPLEQCAKIVREGWTSADREAAITKTKLDAAIRMGGGASVDELRAQLPPLEKLVGEWEEFVTLANEAASYARLDEERKKIIAEGKALRAVHDAEDGEAIKAEYDAAVKACEDARAEHATLAQVERNRRSVATGTFTGECPISGSECPVKDEINARGRESEGLAQVAAVDAREALRALCALNAVRSTSEQKVRIRQARVTQLKGLQERVKALAPAKRSTVGAIGSLEATRAERDRVVGLVMELRRKIRDVEESTKQVEALLVLERQHLEMMTACREAAAIFGRGGAQRRLAEGVLGEVARRANAMLADAGVELTLDVSWEREGKGVADECRSCGAAFPASTKVKTCACGEARGPKMVQRLDVELSARSGAAEDLAGLALSLSAGAWLRGDRGSPWSVVCADEPWAQLDKAHRRAASAHVPALLTAAHVEQAFIISHDPMSVASLPGRIVITNDGKWSRVTAA